MNTGSPRRNIYRNLDSLSLSAAAHIDRVTRFTESGANTVLNSEDSALIRLVMSREELNGLEGTDVTRIRDTVAKFERLVLEPFQGHLGNRPFTLKFHPLDRLTEDLGKSEWIEVLDA